MVPQPYGTTYKPVNELGRDGGWFTAASESAARTIAAREFPAGDFTHCKNCQER